MYGDLVAYNNFCSIIITSDEPMERDDFALDEAWTEVNVIAKILDEHLIPVLTEAISKEPARYMNESSCVENKLTNLGTVCLPD